MSTALMPLLVEAGRGWKDMRTVVPEPLSWRPGELVTDYTASLGLTSFGTILFDTAGCLLNLVRHEGARIRHIHTDTNPLVSRGRDAVTWDYGREPVGPSDWLFLVDGDMVFPPDTLQRLVTVGEQCELDVVSGLYTQPHGWTEASMVDWTEKCPWIPITGLERDRVYEVDAVGAGCVVIRREMLRDIYEAFPRINPWVEQTGKHPNFDRSISIAEDYGFCLKVKECGGRNGTTTFTDVGHRKLLTIRPQLSNPRD